MKISSLLCIATLGVAVSTTAVADSYNTFEVTITNLSKSSSLTPIMVAAHKKRVSIFELGAPASQALVALAESGNHSGLAAAYTSQYDQVVSTGLLVAGDSITLTFDNLASNTRFSLASMVVPTNDAFVAVESVRVAKNRKNKTIQLTAYDAGSETNNELCDYIPGPTCQGAALSPEDAGEGYVYVHSGIHGIADLSASQYTWQNPIAIVKIKRLDK